MTPGVSAGHDETMTTEDRRRAEEELVAAGAEYKRALDGLAAADARAGRAAKAAKLAGVSQHEIAKVMGEDWAKDNNPQYPPVTNL